MLFHRHLIIALPPLLDPPRARILGHAENRIANRGVAVAGEHDFHQREVVVEHLRVAQAGGAPVLVDGLLEVGVGALDLRVHELELGGLERRLAVEAVVEGVEGEGLEVVVVCFDAHRAELVEGGYDLVAGEVEDPVSGVGGLVGGRALGRRVCVCIPDSLHAGPSFHCLGEGQFQTLALVRAFGKGRGAAYGTVGLHLGRHTHEADHEWGCRRGVEGREGSGCAAGEQEEVGEVSDGE